MPAVQAADPVTHTFTGNVSAAATNRQVFTFTVQGPARLDAAVDWTSTAPTNLDLQIINRSGQIVAASNSTTAKPDTLTYNFAGTSSGTWKLGVVARRGTTDFTATVTVTPKSTATTTTDPGPTTTSDPGSTTTTDPGATTTTLDLPTTTTIGLPTTTTDTSTAPTTTTDTTTRPSTTTTDTTTPTTSTTRPPGSTTTTLPPPTAGNTPSHAPEFMLENHEVNEAIAIDQAKRFSFISASRAMFKHYVPKMKQANPNLTLLVYLIGTHLRDVEIEGIPDAWFAKDSQGRRITSPYGFYLMDPSHPEWINFVRQRCVDWLAYSGYDGCFLDTMGIAPTLPGYESALPINKATGKAWTSVDWLKATTHISNVARDAIKPKLLLIQGTAQGDRYYHSSYPTSQLLNGSDGSMIEMFLRTPEASVTKFPTEARWKQDVNMVADHGTKGKYVLGVTKVWAHGATPAHFEQWHEYSLGSFMLGYSGRGGAFVFLRSKKILENTQISAAIGTPQGAYAKTGAGYYERNFSNGKVLVNPTTANYTVNLGGSYKNLKGQTVTSVTLGPNRGAILVKA